MEFQQLEKWLDEYRQTRIEYINKLSDATKIWNTAYADAHNSKKRKEMEVNEWSQSKGYYKKTVQAVPVVIDGKEYLQCTRYIDGVSEYYADCGLGKITNSDMMLLKYPKDERLKKIEKDVDGVRKTVIAKVKKICTEDIVEVAESSGNGLYVRGANGKVANMNAIYAGGYNIQCLHIRILVKEMKSMLKDIQAKGTTSEKIVGDKLLDKKQEER